MPVGASVAEGVAILVLRGAMSESVERCLYEAAEHLGGGVGLPSRVCVRPLAACVVGWHYLAYKTTRKHDRVHRATAVEAVESKLIGSS